MWRQIVTKLVGPSLDSEGRFAVYQGVPLTKNHRHFSHLLALWPLRELPMSGQLSREKSLASLDLWSSLPELGSLFGRGPCAAMNADLGRHAAALDNMTFLVRTRILGSGWYGEGGGYTTVCNEAPYLAAYTLADWLLQSWNATTLAGVGLHNGPVKVLELFKGAPNSVPLVNVSAYEAAPASIATGSFFRLAAEGGFLVSAVREKVAATDGDAAAYRARTVFVAVESTVGGPCVLRIPDEMMARPLRTHPANVSVKELGDGGLVQLLISKGQSAAIWSGLSNAKPPALVVIAKSGCPTQQNFWGGGVIANPEARRPSPPPPNDTKTKVVLRPCKFANGLLSPSQRWQMSAATPETYVRFELLDGSKRCLAVSGVSVALRPCANALHNAGVDEHASARQSPIGCQMPWTDVDMWPRGHKSPPTTSQEWTFSRGFPNGIQSKASGACLEIHGGQDPQKIDVDGCQRCVKPCTVNNMEWKFNASSGALVSLCTPPCKAGGWCLTDTAAAGELRVAQRPMPPLKSDDVCIVHRCANFKTDDSETATVSTTSTTGISGWTRFLQCEEHLCSNMSHQIAYIVSHAADLDFIMPYTGDVWTGGPIPAVRGRSRCYANATQMLSGPIQRDPSFRFSSTTHKEGDGSGRYLCVPESDAAIQSWAAPIRVTGVKILPIIEAADFGDWSIFEGVHGLDFFDTCAAVALQHGFSGWSLDWEPKPAKSPPSGSVAAQAELESFARFLTAFATRLKSHGLELSTAEPNRDLLNTTVPNEPYPLNVYGYRSVANSGARVLTMSTYYGVMPRDTKDTHFFAKELTAWQVITPPEKLSIGFGAIYLSWASAECKHDSVGANVDRTSDVNIECLSLAVDVCIAQGIKSIALFQLDVFGWPQVINGRKYPTVAAPWPPAAWWPVLRTLRNHTAGANLQRPTLPLKSDAVPMQHAYFKLARSDLANSSWPTGFTQYSLFVANPGMTEAQLHKVRATVPGGKLLAYSDQSWAYVGKGCSESNGVFAKKYFQPHWAVTDLHTGLPVCPFGASPTPLDPSPKITPVAAAVLMRESADALVRYHTEVTLAVSYDGLYLHDYEEVFPATWAANIVNFTNKSFDCNGDGQPDTLETLQAQYAAWKPYYAAQLRKALGQKMMLANTGSPSVSDAALDGQSIEFEWFTKARGGLRACSAEHFGQHALSAAQGGGRTAMSVMWLTDAKGIPAETQCQQLCMLQQSIGRGYWLASTAAISHGQPMLRARSQ
jgi:hypothetical protein